LHPLGTVLVVGGRIPGAALMLQARRPACRSGLRRAAEGKAVPRMPDLPRLLDENPQMRADFIMMLASFFERHHIEVSPDDLGEADDIVGYVFGSHTPGTSAGRSEQELPGAEQALDHHEDGPVT
ncbi:MAG: hypothetical protein ACRDJE_27195, partial [Dehalococcoidia bacterium]